MSNGGERRIPGGSVLRNCGARARSLLILRKSTKASVSMNHRRTTTTTHDAKLGQLWHTRAELFLRAREWPQNHYERASEQLKRETDHTNDRTSSHTQTRTHSDTQSREVKHSIWEIIKRARKSKSCTLCEFVHSFHSETFTLVCVQFAD